jgi:hypothetical protein
MGRDDSQKGSIGKRLRPPANVSGCKEYVHEYPQAFEEEWRYRRDIANKGWFAVSLPLNSVSLLSSFPMPFHPEMVDCMPILFMDDITGK